MSAALAPQPEQGFPADPPDQEDKDVVIVDVEDDGKKKLEFVKTFNVTWKNRETGVIKTGTFQAKRPGLGTTGQIAVYKAKLNGGMVVDQQTNFMHDVMAALHYILVDTPDWWTPAEFFDTKPLMEVWSHVRSWLETFLVGVGR